MKEYELKLQELSKEKTTLNIKIDKILKEKTQLEIKKATEETRLKDLKEEYQAYKDKKTLEDVKEKEKLIKIISEAEEKIKLLGDVNLAAIELYDKRKKELDDVEEKIKKLEEERWAVLEMIKEIEEHKKEAFFETFHAVSENFKKLFKSINRDILFWKNQPTHLKVDYR